MNNASKWFKDHRLMLARVYKRGSMMISTRQRLENDHSLDVRNE